MLPDIIFYTTAWQITRNKLKWIFTECKSVHREVILQCVWRLLEQKEIQLEQVQLDVNNWSFHSAFFLSNHTVIFPQFSPRDTSFFFFDKHEIYNIDSLVLHRAMHSSTEACTYHKWDKVVPLYEHHGLRTTEEFLRRIFSYIFFVCLRHVIHSCMRHIRLLMELPSTKKTKGYYKICIGSILFLTSMWFEKKVSDGLSKWRPVPDHYKGGELDNDEDHVQAKQQTVDDQRNHFPFLRDFTPL